MKEKDFLFLSLSPNRYLDKGSLLLNCGKLILRKELEASARHVSAPV